METNGNHGYFFKGLLIGSFLGGLAGILLAPKSGEELRSGIKEKADKTFEGTKRFYSDTRTKFKDAFAGIACRRERAPFRNIESPEEMAGEV